MEPNHLLSSVWEAAERVRSEREDLEDQLERQDEAHKRLTVAALLEEQELAELKELILQQQRQGKFLPGDAAKRRHRNEEDEAAAVERENALLQLEIQALKERIRETEGDQKALLEQVKFLVKTLVTFSSFLVIFLLLLF